MYISFDVDIAGLHRFWDYECFGSNMVWLFILVLCAGVRHDRSVQQGKKGRRRTEQKRLRILGTLESRVEWSRHSGKKLLRHRFFRVRQLGCGERSRNPPTTTIGE